MKNYMRKLLNKPYIPSERELRARAKAKVRKNYQPDSNIIDTTATQVTNNVHQSTAKIHVNPKINNSNNQNTNNSSNPINNNYFSKKTLVGGGVLGGAALLAMSQRNKKNQDTDQPKIACYQNYSRICRGLNKTAAII